MPNAPHLHAPTLFFWAVVAAVIIVAGFMIWPFVPALLWASVFSILLWPMRCKLINRGRSPTIASLIPTLLVATLIMLPTSVVALYAGAQAYTFISKLKETSAASGSNDLADQAAVEVDKVVTPILRSWGAAEFSAFDYYSDNKADLVSQVKGPIVSAGRRILTGTVMLIIALLTMFFLLKDGEQLLEPVCDLVPLARERTIKVMQHMATTVRSVFVGVVLVSCIQGALAGIAYAIVGVPAPLLWAVITTFLCMVPLLGAPFGYVPLSIMLFSQGKIWQGVFLLAWGFGLVSTIDNILRPILIGGATKLHPMAVFFALIGGSLVMGPVGLMAGPMCLSLLMGVIEILRMREKDQEAKSAPDGA